jgi:hypothetical protein
MDTGYSRHMTNNTTAVATTTDECLLVEFDEAARTIRFLDDDDREVASYTFDTFAAVTSALALDAGRGVVLAGRRCRRPAAVGEPRRLRAGLPGAGGVTWRRRRTPRRRRCASPPT